MQDRPVFHSSELFYFLFCFGHVISHTIQSAPPESRGFSLCRSGQSIACCTPQVIYRFREPGEGVQTGAGSRQASVLGGPRQG
jgi:hypothetical protein